MRNNDKTVFISYRRSDTPWAQAIFHILTTTGYDIFLDTDALASGDFEAVILEEIRARVHFLVLLTPTALQRCGDAGDLFRREIETAIAVQRNIVPIMLDGFSFDSPGIDSQLWSTFATLRRYNGLLVHLDYFPEAMDRLRERYLTVPLDSVLHPKPRDGVPQERSRTRAAHPFSALRVSVSSKTVCGRHEGITELMGDIFLKCTYEDDVIPSGPTYFTVILSASAPITSRISDRGVTEVVLFEVGRPGSANLVPGVMSPTGISQIMFSGVALDIARGETRILQISNLRCNCSSCPASSDAPGLVYAHVSMTGAVVDDPQQKVATIRTGLEFEVRSADNSCELKIDGFEGILLSNLTEKRVATLRFTEGFVNAFKSRAPILRYSWNTHEGDAVCTGESTSLCAVFAPHQGDMRVAGMADSGTCLQAKFSYLRTGLRLFVSTHELGHGEHACLLPSDAENSERVSLMIGDVEVRELPICDGCADAVWEVTNPFCAERSATSLEFAVFASYASNSNNPPFIGSSLVAGGFFPAVACFANGPIPEFSGIFTMFPRRFLTIGA